MRAQVVTFTRGWEVDYGILVSQKDGVEGLMVRLEVQPSAEVLDYFQLIAESINNGTFKEGVEMGKLKFNEDRFIKDKEGGEKFLETENCTHCGEIIFTGKEYFCNSCGRLPEVFNEDDWREPR